MLEALNDTLVAVAPWVLLPSATGAAAAGLTGRRRLAYLLLGLAVAAVVVPPIVGVWWLLSLPPT